MSARLTPYARTLGSSGRGYERDRGKNRSSMSCELVMKIRGRWLRQLSDSCEMATPRCEGAVNENTAVHIQQARIL